MENDFLEKDPSRLIHLEKIPMKEAKYLSLAEVKKFRSAIQDDPRNQLLFEMFIQTGMRLSEVASLNIGDVRGKKSFQVVGKGRKVREIFLPLNLTKLVGNSVNGNPPGSPLFTSYRGERLTRGGIQGLFRKYAAKAGIKRVSVHSLRHTFLTEIYRRTRDLRLTQELAGHSSPVTTMRYTHIGQSEKKAAIQRLYE